MADSTRTPLVVSCPYQLCSQVPMPMLGCTHYKGQSGINPALLVDRVMSGLKSALPLLKPDGNGFKLHYHGNEFGLKVRESHSGEQWQEKNINDKIYPAGTMITGKVSIEITHLRLAWGRDRAWSRVQDYVLANRPSKWTNRLARRLERELTDLLPQEKIFGIDVM